MQESRRKPLLTRCALAVGMAVSAVSGHAVEFNTESGWEGSFSTNLSLGANWRAESQDMSLISAGDGNYVGKPGGTGASNTTGGNLNWDKGERFSTLAKAVVDFSLSRDETGMFARVKAFYDQALKDESVNHGNFDNGYTRGGRLSDASQPDLNKFDGLELLDFYGYKTFYVGENQNPLQVRLGKQVVNWGESLFIQGLNQLNPVDVPALRKPGTEVKEALLPVWALHGNLGLGDGASLEAFYQFEWEPSNIDSCGLFFSPIEYSFSTTPGSGCSGRATVVGTGGNHEANAFNTLGLTNGKDGKDTGQGGLALRLPVDAIDAELGLYALRINSRVPVVSAVLGTGSGFNGAGIPPGTPGAPSTGVPAGGVRLSSPTAPKGFWEYPNGINVLGASLAGNIAGASVGAELSVTPNQPVQLNVPDLLNAALGDVGPLVSRKNAAGAGGIFQGYDEVRKTQLQFNAVTALPKLLGAAQGSLVAEIGMQWNDLPNDGRRYGRAFIFGYGSFGGLNVCNPPAPAAALRNPQAQGCQDDGYVSQFSTGYRLRASLDYIGAFGSGVTLTPSIFFGHDVKGVSSDGQFNEGRIVMTLGLKAVYQKSLQFDFGYTTFANSAKYDNFRDRDYFSASVTKTF